jgi:hypothetical protein
MVIVLTNAAEALARLPAMMTTKGEGVVCAQLAAVCEG